MHLDMKQSCEKCAVDLSRDGEAYICSFECTYCSACAAKVQNVCPHCGGELVVRPRRLGPTKAEDHPLAPTPIGFFSARVWAISLAVWTSLSVIATATIYEMEHLSNYPMKLGTVAGMEFSQILAYAPLTPFAYALACRFPIQRSNWAIRSLLHLGASLVYTLGHILFRALTPYAYWDPNYREFTSALWDPHLHTFRAPWLVLKSMFLGNVVDDVTGAYLPILLIAHVASYYKGFRERELRATQLEGQLAKARLQTLKSQLQPHFLFNTLHSISALMLTDVVAADQMMTSLSDLLRMSLESNGTQVTTLNHEIEFLQVYLNIEKIRFEERLNVIFDIAPDCLDAQVPHLLLQPLVENAVRHGVSRKSTRGEIHISAKHDGDYLHLWVRDNGPGFPEASAEPSKRGLGLRVTEERLLALYGTEQRYEICNLAEGGAQVYLRLPFYLVPRSQPELGYTELMNKQPHRSLQ